MQGERSSCRYLKVIDDRHPSYLDRQESVAQTASKIEAVFVASIPEYRSLEDALVSSCLFIKERAYLFHRKAFGLRHISEYKEQCQHRYACKDEHGNW